MTLEHTRDNHHDATQLLRYAVIEAYREEIRQRYTLENAKRYEEFAGVSAEKLEALREFFLTEIYPPAEVRERLDKAAEHVRRFLHSPRRMLPLAGVALGSLRKFGTSLPKTASIITSTLEAHNKTKELEQIMVREAESKQLAPDQVEQRAFFAPVVASIPPSEMDELRKEMLILFRAMANTDFLHSGLEIMNRGIDVMRSKPRVYSTEDMEGFEYGQRVLKGALGLYRKLSPQEVDDILTGIDRIERDWYESIRAKLGH